MKSFENPKNYPIHYVTYVKGKKDLPVEVPVSVEDTTKQGFHVLDIIADDYKVPEEIPAYHAGFKHMREIAMPRIVELMKKNKNLQGAFIVEGDLCLNTEFTFKKFLEMVMSGKLNKPTWLGYKKILRVNGAISYVVGNFMIYIPRDYIKEMNEEFCAQKRYVYSDRFYTKLVNKGLLQLVPESLASEIEHTSNVKGGIREAECRISLNDNTLAKTKKIKKIQIAKTNLADC
jgi:hypothetical protein